MSPTACVPSNFMANRRVPKFSLNSCAKALRRRLLCPKFHTYPVLKHTKCHISTNLSHFLKLWLLYCQKLFALAPTNRRFAERNRLSGNTANSHGSQPMGRLQILLDSLLLFCRHLQRVKFAESSDKR